MFNRMFSRFLCILLASTAVVAANAAVNPRVELKTSQGTMVIELYPQQAPKSVANFLQYVKDGYYKDNIFHLVI